MNIPALVISRRTVLQAVIASTIIGRLGGTPTPPHPNPLAAPSGPPADLPAAAAAHRKFQVGLL
ncbi:hypothetical protein [Galbitalea soli]|uniref:Uncharacterized protein n=1 Tax=Galbitalea soli TaxID=1268042 RepID=A0A7C9TRA5_9MICO|nr:hypothetical protein [Galbitalea soli]NEM91124.1 hypothetical protein [Galbitalea soli]NYJ29813.1 hypothetical protein [Galbitalea soli]